MSLPRASPGDSGTGAEAAEQLVFIDETWAITAMARRYGRARRGTRVLAAVPHGHRKTTILLAALRHDGLTAPGVFDGAINGARFSAYVEQVLAPTLPRRRGVALCLSAATAMAVENSQSQTTRHLVALRSAEPTDLMAAEAQQVGSVHGCPSRTGKHGRTGAAAARRQPSLRARRRMRPRPSHEVASRARWQWSAPSRRRWAPR